MCCISSGKVNEWPLHWLRALVCLEDGQDSFCLINRLIQTVQTGFRTKPQPWIKADCKITGFLHNILDYKKT